MPMQNNLLMRGQFRDEIGLGEALLWIIFGSGAATLFAALTITEHSPLQILLCMLPAILPLTAPCIYRVLSFLTAKYSSLELYPDVLVWNKSAQASTANAVNPVVIPLAQITDVTYSNSSMTVRTNGRALHIPNLVNSTSFAQELRQQARAQGTEIPQNDYEKAEEIRLVTERWKRRQAAKAGIPDPPKLPPLPMQLPEQTFPEQLTAEQADGVFRPAAPQQTVQQDPQPETSGEEAQHYESGVI